MEWLPEAMIFLIPSVGSIALFSFLAVFAWTEQRRREREAYYRYEFRKKLVDAGEMTSAHVQALMQFEHQSEMNRRRHGLIAAGFIVAGIGGGMLLGLRFIDDEPIWMVGFIPLIGGLSMLAYGALFAPRHAVTPPLGAHPDTPPRRDA